MNGGSESYQSGKGLPGNEGEGVRESSGAQPVPEAGQPQEVSRQSRVDRRRAREGEIEGHSSGRHRSSLITEAFTPPESTSPEDEKRAEAQIFANLANSKYYLKAETWRELAQRFDLDAQTLHDKAMRMIDYSRAELTDEDRQLKVAILEALHEENRELVTATLDRFFQPDQTIPEDSVETQERADKKRQLEETWKRLLSENNRGMMDSILKNYDPQTRTWRETPVEEGTLDGNQLAKRRYLEVEVRTVLHDSDPELTSEILRNYDWDKGIWVNEKAEKDDNEELTTDRILEILQIKMASLTELIAAAAPIRTSTSRGHVIVYTEMVVPILQQLVEYEEKHRGKKRERLTSSDKYFIIAGGRFGSEAVMKYLQDKDGQDNQDSKWILERQLQTDIKKTDPDLYHRIQTLIEQDQSVPRGLRGFLDGINKPIAILLVACLGLSAVYYNQHRESEASKAALEQWRINRIEQMRLDMEAVEQTIAEFNAEFEKQQAELARLAAEEAERPQEFPAIDFNTYTSGSDVRIRQEPNSESTVLLVLKERGSPLKKVYDREGRVITEGDYTRVLYEMIPQQESGVAGVNDDEEEIEEKPEQMFGWVAKAYLSDNEFPRVYWEVPEHGLITTAATNLRDEPSRKAEISFKQLPEGTEFTALGTAGYGNEWYIVEYEGETCYLMADFGDAPVMQAAAENGETNKGKVIVRSSPDEKSKRLTRIESKGTDFRIVGESEDGEWYYVRLGSGKKTTLGWIMKEHVDPK